MVHFTDTDYIKTISNHPVHIMDDQNISYPSAFIPFCSFGGNMSVMGKDIPNFSIPVCNKFKPIVLKGRRCYQVDVNEFKNQVDTEKLRTHGLIFMMDYNEDRLGLETDMDLEAFGHKDFVDFQEAAISNKEALIHIETLGMNNYIIIFSFFFSPHCSILL